MMDQLRLCLIQMNGQLVMDDLSATDKTMLLHNLAERLHSWHIAGVVALVAKIGAAMPVLVSHMLFFVQPLLPFTSWRTTCKTYALVFEEQTSWEVFIRYLEASES